jgi:hypothetical protein
MSEPERRGSERWIRWGYWIVFALMAVGAGRSLLKLARMWGWI